MKLMNINKSLSIAIAPNKDFLYCIFANSEWRMHYSSINKQYRVLNSRGTADFEIPYSKDIKSLRQQDLIDLGSLFLKQYYTLCV